MSALHQHCGPEAPSEMPLLPVEALAMALAAARSRPAAAKGVMAEAALLLVDLRQAGLDVVRGLAPGSRPGRIAILAILLGKLAGRQKPAPRDQIEAERVGDELRTIAFDIGEAARA